MHEIYAYMYNMRIQDALPQLTDKERALLDYSLCRVCFDAISEWGGE